MDGSRCDRRLGWNVTKTAGVLQCPGDVMEWVCLRSILGAVVLRLGNPVGLDRGGSASDGFTTIQEAEKSTRTRRKAAGGERKNRKGLCVYGARRAESYS